MFDNRAVHEFATKYLHLYENEDTLEYQVSERFSDQCFELGFEMDCGNAIEKTYPNMKILDDVGSLRRVINHISDIGLLASAIFSKYRYITHWSYCEELLSENNRTWFILAFERLAELSVEERFVEFSDDDMRQAHIPCIEGILERIHLRTNGLCYGPCPEPEDEVEQHLTIRRDGRVWFYGFNYGEDGVKTVKGRRIQYKMHQRNVNRIFEVFSKKFAQEYIMFYATDIGSWDLKLTNTRGEDFYFSGSMYGEMEYEGIDLTKLLQEELNVEDLWGFGYYEEEE